MLHGLPMSNKLINKKNPKFLNIVLKVKTFLSPSKLLKVCKKIEKNLGIGTR